MDEETGCFRDSQNENYVVKTTEFAEKPRGRCGQQMESCAGGGTLSKKVCEKRKLDGRGGIIPTAERLRGKNYAPEKCAAEIRQAGNHIIGIPAASSATYGRRQCGDGCSSPFFHYYNIIVTFLICRDFFDRAPKAP